MTAYRMGRASGYVSIVSPDKPTVEGDTLQCVHCGGHFYTKPGSGMQRGWCTRCKGPHCGRNNCWECVPFMKKIEEMERRQRFHRQIEAAVK
jgi:hypothetical protein